jgi:hypothetical protein
MIMRNSNSHRWSVRDDLAALYVHKFGYQRVAGSVVEVASLVGIEPGSFKMRVSNFKALDGGGGLSNASRQSREVYGRYARLSEPELRRLAFLSKPNTTLQWTEGQP